MPERVTAIEYIRGVAMLGVVGIHTGGYSLSGPEVNIHLFALLEIVTRFSVPIFFFVSAFGLFLHHRPQDKLDYRAFFLRRLKTVVVPYLVWSLLYMAHAAAISGATWPWSPPHLYEFLAFGLASYQLYFLVILIWFYLLMPLWRAVVPALAARPLPGLALLLALQIAFNYWSSYQLQTAHSDNYYLNLAIIHRMSFWVLHYVFVFLLGAVCAVRLSDFAAFVARHRRTVNLCFAVTLAGMLAAYYWLLGGLGYPPERAVNHVQQLSPVGVLYTFAACLFLFVHCNRPLPPPFAAGLAFLGCHSYAVYLVHPFIMYYLATGAADQGVAMTAPVVVVFYCLTVTVSLLFGVILQRAASLLPLLSLMLTGTTAAKVVKPGT